MTVVQGEDEVVGHLPQVDKVATLTSRLLSRCGAPVRLPRSAARLRPRKCVRTLGWAKPGGLPVVHSVESRNSVRGRTSAREPTVRDFLVNLLAQTDRFHQRRGLCYDAFDSCKMHRSRHNHIELSLAHG